MDHYSCTTAKVPPCLSDGSVPKYLLLRLIAVPKILGMPSLPTLGQQVASARRAARMRQVDLASRARVSRATIDALENGRATDMRFSRLTRILLSLGLDIKVESPSRKLRSFRRQAKVSPSTVTTARGGLRMQFLPRRRLSRCAVLSTAP